MYIVYDDDVFFSSSLKGHEIKFLQSLPIIQALQAGYLRCKGALNAFKFLD